MRERSLGPDDATAAPQFQADADAPARDRARPLRAVQGPPGSAFLIPMSNSSSFGCATRLALSEPLTGGSEQDERVLEHLDVTAGGLVADAGIARQRVQVDQSSRSGGDGVRAAARGPPDVAHERLGLHFLSKIGVRVAPGIPRAGSGRALRRCRAGPRERARGRDRSRRQFAREQRVEVLDVNAPRQQVRVPRFSLRALEPVSGTGTASGARPPEPECRRAAPARAALHRRTPCLPTTDGQQFPLEPLRLGRRSP